MKAGKKFLSPRLYPLDRKTHKEDGTRVQWFIKFKEEDFNKGGFKYSKYTGMLNLVTDVQERLKLADIYIGKMKRGEPLPDCQGARTATDKVLEHPRANTNVLTCCDKFLERMQIAGRANATIISYRSVIRIFSEWLQRTGRSDLAIGGIDKDIAFEYLGYLQARGNKNRGDHKTQLGAIWEDYKEVIRLNPWKGIQIATDPKRHHLSYPNSLQQRIKETLPSTLK